jgi:hypothetical protein
MQQGMSWVLLDRAYLVQLFNLLRVLRRFNSLHSRERME